MSIFMTAEQKPFFAGTYFPPTSRYGMVGFRDLLIAIARKWEAARKELLESAEHIVGQISVKENREHEEMDSSLPAQAVELFAQSFDAECGGFGQAPKFPTPHNLLFLMLYSYLKREDAVLKQEDMIMGQVEVTLEKMRRGGIFDHIGHGFSRYSTDRYYLVPHFEKMLYDNALLMIAYAVAYRISGNPVFLDTAEKTAGYILREMTGENGEFYAAQDADSEGEEGKFYVWSHEEVCKVLGEERCRQFCEYFAITRQGNFEGKNIPNLLSGGEICDVFDKERKMLYDYRQTRASLHLDDKVLTAWNALMISAMAMLYRIAGKQEYLLAAKRAQQFIEENLADGNILYVGCRNKVRSVKGFLDEYAYDAAALISLYEATAEEAYLIRAEEICGELEKQFADENGGYFLYGAFNSELITRPKESYDGALPSGNSMAAYCLVRLSQLSQGRNGSRTEDSAQTKGPAQTAAYRRAAEKQLAYLSGEAAHYPAGHCMFLIAMLYYFYPPQKITVILSKEDSSEQVMADLPLLADVILLTQETEEYKMLNGKTTYYICKDHTCFPPTNQAPFFHKNIT